MDVVIAATGEEVGRIAAEEVASVVRRRRDAVLGVATGSSPLTTYRELSRQVRNGSLEFSEVRAFALDEYVGLSADHPESYRRVIHREVVVPLGLTPELVHVPDGDAADLDGACARYEEMIRDAGGIDLQLLGIGTNGHIGFNEPTSSFASRTRPTALTSRTRRENARFFGSLDEVPVRCVTQGIDTILDARSIVLVAHGEAKAEAVAQMVEGPLTSMCPASALQLHPHVMVVVDDAAAARLTMDEYYRREPVAAAVGQR